MSDIRPPQPPTPGQPRPAIPGAPGQPAPQQPRVMPQITPRVTPMGQPRPAVPGAPAAPGQPPRPAPPKPPEDDDAPISLVDEPAAGTPVVSKIKAMGIAGAHQTRTMNRKTTVNGTGAIRVRSFHGRLSEEGLAFLDDKINEWLDTHPDIEVKFVTTNIGTFEGKLKELALVVNVWY